VAYTVPFAVRIYSNTLSLLAANVNPGATPPFGASSALYYELFDDPTWMTGGGNPLVDANSTFSSLTIPNVTPVFMAMWPLYNYLPMSVPATSTTPAAPTHVLKIASTTNSANSSTTTGQMPASDVFSAAFYNAAAPSCNGGASVTIAVANGTYLNQGTASTNVGPRTITINGLPTGKTATINGAKLFSQACYNNNVSTAGACPYQAQLTNASLVNASTNASLWSYSSTAGTTTFTLPYMPMHSAFTAQICYN
jgi:hypothetical protein